MMRFVQKGLWLLIIVPVWLSGQTLGESHVQQLQRSIPPGFAASDVAELVITDEYQSTHNGVTHLYVQQVYQGISVEKGRYSAHFDRNGNLLREHNRLIPSVSKRHNTLESSLSAFDAIAVAAAHLEKPLPVGLEALEVSNSPDQEMLFAGGNLSVEPIPVHLSLTLNEDDEVRLAWYLRIYEHGRAHWWNYWVDAVSGEVLDRHDWVVSCNWEESRPFQTRGVHTHSEAHHPERTATPGSIRSTADGSSYRILPWPVESPSHGAFQLVSEPADSLASPFGWHDVDGAAGVEYTITRGNNVYALEDTAGTNDQTGFSPDGGNTLTFDFPFDPQASPSANGPAAVVNLFYWNNVMHDIWYHIGFDEASGNFQENNYGRGGEGADFVVADARDGSGFNNANFATPPDGFSPRMQMFIWNPVYEPALTVLTPSSIAGGYDAPGASFGPGLPSTPLSGEVVLMNSNGSNEACGAADDPAAITGKIALVYRGTCTFVSKVQNAQDAGAIAVIVVNNQTTNPFPMGGTGGENIVIPALMVSKADGDMIAQALETETVTVEMVLTPVISGEDSDFDNGVIAHEYTHGISNRLTGGPSQAGGLSNEEQAGEGWSDWFGLVVTHRTGDTRNTPRGIATFLRQQPNDGTGLRPARYSADMSINPLTYDDIKTLSVPHGVGSVMATMLWDLYWDLVDEYGFDPNLRNPEAGNVMAMQLVVDGLKLQPSNPGFVDVRDAILLADQVNYNGANQCLIWNSFARRGLGYSADQGSVDNRGDGIEAFDLPPLCQDVLYVDNQTDAILVDPLDTLSYRVLWSNRTGKEVGGLTVQGQLPLSLDYLANLGECAATQSGNDIFFDLDTLPDVFRDTCVYFAQVREDAPRSIYTQYDSLEGDVADYQIISVAGTDAWSLETRNPRSGDFAFFVPNVGANNDQILEIPGSYRVNDKTVFAFWHSYNTEAAWDGGWVEFQRSGSSEWEDMGPYFVINGYNTGVGFNNPYGTHAAFGGNSGGYIESWADLSALDGALIRVRFRFVSDNNTSEEGWDVDDIGFLDAEHFGATACLRDSSGIITCNSQVKETYISPDPAILVNVEETLLPDTEVKIYPNPARTILYVSLLQPKPQPVSLSLGNLLGQELWSETAGSAMEQDWQIDVSAIPAGIYLLSIRQGDRLRVEKIRVE